MKKFLFFLRAYNDFDHLAPLIWKCIKEGDEPVILITTKLKIETDYRFKLITAEKNIRIVYDEDVVFEKHFQAKTLFQKLLRRFYMLRRNPNNFVGRVYRNLFFDLSKEMNFLRYESFHACIFEWSTPFARGDKIEKYFIASKALGIRTFALPHGCNIFVNSDVTHGYRESLSRGKLVDQSETSLFDYYIFQNPTRRDGWIQWGFDPAKTQAWGSLRFFPDWASKNLKACPKFSSEKDKSSKLKVVFMQFQKEYNIDNVEVLNFLKGVSNIEEISLVVKDATREGKSFYDQNKASKELGESLIAWVGNEIHSPALIRWADLVIVIGGSIGIEAMLQKKHILYPSFLSSNYTLYEKFNAAHCTHSAQESFDLINDLKEGKNIPISDGTDKMFTEIIYSGREKYDVLEKYYREISSDHLNY